MRCKIVHESGNRIRLQFIQKHMTFQEADLLEAYINRLAFVRKASVNERTCTAIVFYDSSYREELKQEISRFGYERSQMEVVPHTGREIRHQYEDRMFYHIAKQSIRRLIFPIPLRRIFTIWRAIPYFVEGVKCLSQGRIGVPVLDALSIGVSLLQGNFATAGNIMFLLGTGDLMEEWTHKRSVEDLARSMALNVDKVWMITDDNTEVLVEVSEIRTGDRIVVRTGNVIPLDGTVLEGQAEVNQSSMTGESEPVYKEAGGYVYAGTVIDEGEIIISVKQEAGEGQYDRIVRMIEESERLKSNTEKKANELADRLVPYTLGATLLTYLLTRNPVRAVSILMVDFCCALKLSMPIAVLSAMREAGDHEISVKGGKFLEAFAEADTIIFDKTGTITEASPVVTDVISFRGEDSDEMLRLAACLEEHYPHSMANAVVEAAVKKGLDHEEKHSKVEYVVAHGIASSIDGKKVVIGSRHFVFEDENIQVDQEEREILEKLSQSYSYLYMAIAGRLAAVIQIEDPVKEGVKEVIEQLHQKGYERIVMLTGDGEQTAKRIAQEVGMDSYVAEVLPEDKAAFVKAEQTAGRTVVMVGDGVNDSLALSEADVGIAVTSGAPIAREIADITLSAKNLKHFLTLADLSKGLLKRTRNNYYRIIGINSILILLGGMGVLAPSATALLHNASTILVGGANTKNLLLDKKTPIRKKSKEGVFHSVREQMK